MSTPSSVIYVCAGVPLDNRYEHSIHFGAPSYQQAYFASKVVKTFEAYTYLRKSWSIKVGATMEEARLWNYLYFQNVTNGKGYYYFINNIEYVNDLTVELFLELDVIQTYMFDYSFRDCFIERQHTETDDYGEHNVPENLETGELITAEYGSVDLSELAIMVMSTYDPSTTQSSADITGISGMRYGNMYSGLYITVCQLSDWAALSAKLMLLDSEGISDGIFNIWMYPKALINIGTEEWDTGVFLKHISKTNMINFPTQRGTDIDGYTPKNRKLCSYPYQMIYVTDNNGGAATYQYDLFGDPSNPVFRVVGSISPDAGVRLFPVNYKGQMAAYEEGMTLTNFPTCSWAQDTYKLWLAQNQNQHNLTLATAGLSIAAGIGTAVATGGAGAAIGLGSAMSGAQTIASTLAQKADMAIQPPQAKGAQSASINIDQGMHTFTLSRKTITAEFAKIIDDYFTMYGYKINRVQKPNITARPAFTYIKTIGCQIIGGMCTEDIVAIENIFDKGITFWKDPNKVADYTQDNSV